jgi:hypothetical protein
VCSPDNSCNERGGRTKGVTGPLLKHSPDPTLRNFLIW